MNIVYRVRPHPELQSLAFEDGDAFFDRNLFAFRGAPMLATWEEQVCWITNPLKAQGDFYNLMSGTMALTQRAMDALVELLSPVAEFLPIRVDGERLYLLNVTRTVDALDRERAVMKMRDGVLVGSIQRHAFIAGRIQSESVFRIPEEPSLLLSASNSDVPRQDFRAQFQATGLKGLEFTEVWSQLRTDA